MATGFIEGSSILMNEADDSLFYNRKGWGCLPSNLACCGGCSVRHGHQLQLTKDVVFS